MDAVKILSETWPLILERNVIPESQIEEVKSLFLDQDYVIIAGTIDDRGNPVPYVVIPIRVFAKYYEHDPVAIQHDWDQVVKPMPTDELYRLPYARD